MEYWIITKDNRQEGPYTLEALEALNVLTWETPVWHDGLPDWVYASDVEELAPLLPVPQPPAVPVDATVDNNIDNAAVIHEIQPTATVQPESTVSPVIYVPAHAIPPGYVPVVLDGETPKCPPTYLVWAIICTILCFLPLGVCAIICSSKVKGHFNAGRLDKAYRMSERAALFVILSFVIWLVWLPFSIVFAMM